MKKNIIYGVSRGAESKLGKKVGYEGLVQAISTRPRPKPSM